MESVHLRNIIKGQSVLTLCNFMLFNRNGLSANRVAGFVIAVSNTLKTFPN